MSFPFLFIYSTVPPCLTPSMLSSVSMMAVTSSMSITPLLSTSYKRKENFNLSMSWWNHQNIKCRLQATALSFQICYKTVLKLFVLVVVLSPVSRIATSIASRNSLKSRQSFLSRSKIRNKWHVIDVAFPEEEKKQRRCFHSFQPRSRFIVFTSRKSLFKQLLHLMPAHFPIGAFHAESKMN